MTKRKRVTTKKDDTGFEQLPTDESSPTIIPIVVDGEAHQITDDTTPGNTKLEKEREGRSHEHEYKMPVGDSTPIPEKQKPTQKQNAIAETLKKQSSYTENNPVSKDHAKSTK